MSPYFLFGLPFEANLLHNTKWRIYNLRNKIGWLFIPLLRVSTFQKDWSMSRMSRFLLHFSVRKNLQHFLMKCVHNLFFGGGGVREENFYRFVCKCRTFRYQDQIFYFWIIFSSPSGRGGSILQKQVYRKNPSIRSIPACKFPWRFTDGTPRVVKQDLLSLEFPHFKLYYTDMFGLFLI